MGIRMSAHSRAAWLLRVVLSVCLLVPLVIAPGAPAMADVPYSDTPWKGYPGDDIVLGGVTRQKIVDNMSIYAKWGFNANFAWYSEEKLMYTWTGDTRAWAIGRSASGAFYDRGQWWKRMELIFTLAPRSFTAFTYGGHFIARCNGAFSRPAAPLPTVVTNPAPPRISGTLWHDLDADGVMETGEPRQSGATVRFSRGGIYAGEAQTDANGRYEFVIDANAGRLPGAWTVQADVGSGWYATTPAQLAVDVREGSYSAGRDYGGKNVGLARAGSVAGLVWHDLDGDGAPVVDEPGLGGWSVVLSKAGAVVAEAMTDDSGRYVFGGVPVGVYEVEQAPPVGWERTMPASGSYAIAVASGDAKAGYDFGYSQGGSITPLKADDVDMDGEWDSEFESLLAGWTMHLGDDALPPVVTTDSLESAPCWDGLQPGTYVVREEARAGYASTAEPVRTVVLGAGQRMTVPFLAVRLASIHAEVFSDDDGDGARTGVEAGIEGRRITLRRAGVVVAEKESGPDGQVTFSDLMPGTYTVAEDVPPPYWSRTTDHERDIVLTAGANAIVGLGTRLLGDVEGAVYEDLDGDGAAEPGEPPLPGVAVTLVDAGGSAVGLPAVSGADGSYRFAGVAPGGYTVEQTARSRWLTTGVSQHDLAVAGGRSNQVTAFVQAEGATVSGSVFDDSDADGVQSADEGPAAGHEIVLERSGADGWSVEATLASAPDGTYSFGMLRPAAYRVSHVVPEHWRQTATPAALGTLASGETRAENDFGSIQLASLALYRWDDTNGNGTWDAGEPPVPGWEFDIEGTAVDGSPFTRLDAPTDADGTVLIEDVLPGEYAVGCERIDCSVDAAGNVTETGWSSTTPDDVTVLLGEGDARVEAFGGLHLGAIRGRVTHELYGTGIAGVTIVLEETGETSVTDAEGYYTFTHVEPNETSGCPTPDYLVGMDLSGTGLFTHDAVDRSLRVVRGSTGRVDFSAYEGSLGNQPHNLGYWKNWDKRYTTAQMQAFVDRIKAGSNEFDDLDPGSIQSVLQIDKRTSSRAKARAQYLAFWLNTASGDLGLATIVDAGGVTDWQTVLTRATDAGLIAVIDLIHDAEDVFASTWVPQVWDTLRSVFEQLNDGELT